jgi:hypothetical protein
MMLPRIALAQSELVGTWKLNVEKSKFNPGPAPKSSVLTYEAVGEGVKVTNEVSTPRAIQQNPSLVRSPTTRNLRP